MAIQTNEIRPSFILEANPDVMPMFYTFVKGSVIEISILLIPQTWVQSSQMILCDNLTIKLPNEEIVNASWYQCSEAMWVHDNWHYMAMKFSIRLGYTMFFKYEAEGLFSITFMDLEGCDAHKRVPCTSLEQNIIIISSNDDGSDHDEESGNPAMVCKSIFQAWELQGNYL